MAERRVPRIRFKGFEEDWEQRKLLDCIQKITDFRGRTPKKLGMDWSESGYLALSALNVKDGYIDFSQDVHYGNQALYDKWMSGNELHEGQVLFTTEAPMGNVAQVPDNKRYILSQRTIAFDVKENIITEKFLAILLRSTALFNTLTSLSSGGTAKGVSQKSLAGVDVQIPMNLNEQTLLADYFRNLDHLITLHQSKSFGYILKTIVNYTLYWEQRKLEDFGKATGGTSIESEFSEDGIYKVISIGSYSENSVYNDQGIRAIKSGKTSNRVLNRNDLTMILNDKTTSGNIIGRVLLIEESGIYVYNQRTERIEIYLDEYDPVFLYEMLNAPNIREKIIKQAQGNTQIYVNWTAISLLEYMIPSKEEQVKIGEYLHSISNLITLHQLEPFQLIFKAIAYRIIDYAKSKPLSSIK